MAKLLYRLGIGSAKRPWIALLSWLIALGLAVGGFLTFGGTLTNQVDIPDTETAKVTDQLEEEFPDASKGSGDIVFQTDDGSELTADQKSNIETLLNDLEDENGVDSTMSPFQTEDDLDEQKDEIAQGHSDIDDAESQIADGEEQLEDGRDQLESSQEELDSGQEQLDQAKEQAEAQGLPEEVIEQQFGQQQQQLDQGREQLEEATSELNAQEQELEDNKQELADSKEELEYGERLVELTEDYHVVSEDGSTAVATLTFDQPNLDVNEDDRQAINTALDDADIDGVNVYPTTDISQEVPDIVGLGEVVGLVVAGIVLVIMLGTFITAGLPIFNALLGVGVGISGAMAFSGTVDMMSVTPVLGLMLGLAVGIDYALFIVNRHRKQLKANMPLQESIGMANGTSGNAVVFAGTTVVIALAALNVTGIDFLGLMGTVGAVAVVLAVLVAITMTPALLSWIGPKALSRKERRILAEQHSHGEHAAYSEETRSQSANQQPKPMLTSRAVLQTVGAVLVAGVIAIPFLSMRLGMPDGSQESPGTPAYEAYKVIQEQFGDGRNGPLVGVVDVPDDLSDTELTERQADIGEDLAEIDHVKQVVPAGTNDDDTMAMFQVVPEDGPNDQSTEQLVHQLRDTTVGPDNGELKVAGLTSGFVDISETLADALPIYLGLVVGLSFLIMILVFRSILVPLIATGGFLLSVFATMGAVTAIYQWGWLAPVFDVHEPAPILAFLPTILVGVLFGLAMDYQLFISSGMREAYVHGSPAPVAVQEGFQNGRAVVIAAALIMMSVFAGFIFSDSSMIRPIGFGLTFGVLMDAFLVRLVLIPSLMHLLGKSAWWLPKWISRILPNVDVEGAALERNHDTGLGNGHTNDQAKQTDQYSHDTTKH